jgi:hypothetical protein
MATVRIWPARSYVAEDPLMDLPEVRQVVAGRDGRFVQQDQGRMSDLPLRGLKPGGGAQPELVVQDAGDRITVRSPGIYGCR